MLEILSLTLGPAATNAYLVGDSESGDAVVIDPAWDGDRILAAAQARQWRVTSIWLTHAHFDHIGGSAAVADGSSPPPPVALHPEDYWLWRREGLAPLFGLRLDPGPEPTIDLVPGMHMYLAGERFEVRHAPGHTNGHVMFYLAAQQALFCGDVIFKGSVGRADLPGGDYETLMASIRREVLSLPDGVRLLPGHGPVTTVGEERVGNPFLQW